MLAALTLLPGPAKAAIALQDGSTTITYAATTAINLPFTVTAGASVLVVLETDRGNSTTAPASLSYGPQTLVEAVTTTTATVYRNVSIFYLFNPAPGTHNITGTANNASVWLSAYTLSGVVTNSPPLTGSVVTGGDTSVNFGVSGVPSAAWAAVNGVYANDTPGGTFTITGTGGIPAIDSNANDTTYGSMGYIANLNIGADTFTYTLTSGGTGTQKMALTAAVFTPLVVTGAPVITTQPQSQSLVAGQTATFTAAVSGTGPLFYQWQFNGTNLTDGAGIIGSLTNTLTLSNLNANEAGNYSVVITNVYDSVTSALAVLTILLPAPPIFTEQPTPAAATNYVGGLVTFSASVQGTPPISLQWQHDGTNLPYATASSLSLSQLQAGSAGTYSLVASNYLGATNSLPAILTVLPPQNPSALNVYTYHYDNTRQGANTNEVLLMLASVNPATFGKLFTYPVDGHVYAEPLYVSGVNIPGQGIHNVVYVVTEHDTVYAFDADSNAGPDGGLLWSINLGQYAVMPNNYFGNRYGAYHDIVPAMGITSTPVIDPVSGTMYLDAFTQEGTGNNFVHRIHALKITDGTEQPYSPVIVAASVPGKGVDSVNGVVTFNAEQELQRPALTLAGGIVYVSYSGFADTDPYHGWVLDFNATNLVLQTNLVFNTTPNATVAVFGANAAEGGLWMGGNGLSVDVNTNLYFEVGNGSFSANTNGGDYADSFMKLSTASNRLAVADYFTPYNQASLAASDADLGSGGPMLLPDAVGSTSHPHLIIGAGKEGKIYLVDRDNMGHYNTANDDQIVQEVPGAIGSAFESPAYFNHQIYYQGDSDVMKAFFISNAVITPAPVSKSSTSFGYHGSTPVISANGLDNAIAWVIQGDAYASGGPAVLHAYNATNLAQELYNSSMNPSRDNPGGAVKFTMPTVINGKVYVGAEYALSVYGTGLFVTTPTISPGGGIFTNSVTVTLADTTAGASIYYTLDGTTPTISSLLYTGPFNLTNSVLLQAVAAVSGMVNSGVASTTFINSSAIGGGTGLSGAYYSNRTSASPYTGSPTLVRTDAVVNFDWSSAGPDPSVGQTDFTVRWTGSVQPQFSQTYTFYATADDGVRLWVNGQELVNGWIDEGATTYQGTITLKAQRLYNIRMEYYQNGGGTVAQLQWSSLSTAQTVIPQTQLYPYTNPPPTVVMAGPADGSIYTADASVTVSANADAPYNPVGTVSFYANGSLLGTLSNSVEAPLYEMTVPGLAAGSYALRAVATDGSGLGSTSAPVNITVNAGSGAPYGLTTNASVSAFLSMPTTFNGTLPALLSETGAFDDMTNRIPADGLIPYVPNTPLWSDGAVKSRYMALPNNGGLITPDEQIQFAPTNSWTFPAGTVFVKNFDLVVDETNANTPLRRLETRLLVRDINGAVYGVTYKWRPDNSDADLLLTSSNEDILITNASGVRTQTWYYPSPADCLTCHTPVANYVLGVNTRQLNGNLAYPATGVTDNQLRTLNRLGLFNPAFDEGGISNFDQMSALTNLTASLENRARSYLDANCAQCHQPGGTGITFDARYDTPLALQNITNYPAAHSLGVDNAKIIAPKDVWRSTIWERINTTNDLYKMPPLARSLIDTNAVQVFTDWINSLPGTPALAPPAITPAGGTFGASVNVALQSPDTNAAIYYTLDGSLPTTNSFLYSGGLNLTNSGTTLMASAFEDGYDNSIATGALFFVQPLSFTSAGFTGDNVFQMGFLGASGNTYVLEASTNLLHWTPISTNMAVTNLFNLLDPDATNFPCRFYRVRQQ